MTARFLGFVLGFVLLFAARSVRAETEAGLPVVINAGGSGFDPAKIEEAIQKELGVRLQVDPSAPERLEVVVTGRRANVTFFRKEGDPVTRSVALPKDEERALETIAYLAGNLARDEAAELLQTLTPATTDAELPPPPPPPPPEPPPAAPAAPAAAPPPAPKLKVAPEPPPKPSGLIEPNPFAFNISVLYPRALLSHTEKRRMSLELGLLSSRIGAVKGAALMFGYQRIDGHAEGVSFALGWNRTGPVSGLEGSLLVSEGYGLLNGLSFASIANLRDGDVEGAIGSFIVAKAKNVTGAEGGLVLAMAESVTGAQGSLIVSHASGNVVGVQGAGIAANTFADVTGGAVAGISTSARDVKGVQLAGITNIGRKVDGGQVAGLFNLAGDLTGAQIGLVNVGHRVRGLQIGLVNVADENRGGAIGLVNVAGNGRIQPSVWFSGPDFMGNIGLKFVSGYTYSQLGAGYNASSDRFAGEVSAGLHLDAGDGFAEAGVGIATTLNTVAQWSTVRTEARLESRFGYEILPWLTPFAGGALTYRLEGEGQDVRGHYFVGVAAL